MRVRRATSGDAEVLASLITDYVRESYPGCAGSNPAQLRRDVLSERSHHHLVVAERHRQLVGFVEWDKVYDLHWGMSGAQIEDLYVAPAYRGLGVALLLLAQAAREVRDEGSTFLRGGALDSASLRRFYGRLAVVSPTGDTYLSGRAFQHFTQLAGRPLRAVVRALPPVAWNFE
jgi:GNAT superfamily N-acetyltransferase